MLQAYHRFVGAIDINRLFLGVDQPSELCAAGRVLLHLFLQDVQLIGRRANLGDKVGAQRRKTFSFRCRQLFPARTSNPGKIGDRLAPVGSVKPVDESKPIPVPFVAPTRQAAPSAQSYGGLSLPLWAA